jgi:DNA-binding transcriptional MerR regulator
MPYHFTISKFGKLTGLTPKALRIYEREGLLRPNIVNPKTGYRYYSQAQAKIAERIRLLKGRNCCIGTNNVLNNNLVVIMKPCTCGES